MHLVKVPAKPPVVKGDNFSETYERVGEWLEETGFIAGPGKPIRLDLRAEKRRARVHSITALLDKDVAYSLAYDLVSEAADHCAHSQYEGHGTFTLTARDLGSPAFKARDLGAIHFRLTLPEKRVESSAAEVSLEEIQHHIQQALVLTRHLAAKLSAPTLADLREDEDELH